MKGSIKTSGKVDSNRDGVGSVAGKRPGGVVSGGKSNDRCWNGAKLPGELIDGGKGATSESDCSSEGSSCFMADGCGRKAGGSFNEGVALGCNTVADPEGIGFCIVGVDGTIGGKLDGWSLIFPIDC